MGEPPNRILEFLTSPPQPDGEASRSNRRRRSSAPIELSWLDGQTWRTTRARLLDISRGGAGLVSAQPPPLTRVARLRFLRGEGSPWVEVEILGVEPVTSKRHRVRVRFEAPCPSFLLRLAVLDAVEVAEEEPGVRYTWVGTDSETSPG
jgi:PilZ domain